MAIKPKENPRRPHPKTQSKTKNKTQKERNGICRKVEAGVSGPRSGIIYRFLECDFKASGGKLLDW
jgi:hypothetical protein